MLKAAIVGVSGFGRVHYEDLIRYYNKGEISIVGATVINQDEEKEKCEKLKSIGCKLFTDFNQMLDELKGSVDICFIPTGISLHAPMSIAAVNAGMNVYVEKPITAIVPELEEMKAAEKSSGKFIAVGYQSIYQPITAKIKRTILEGKIGKIDVIKFFGLTIRDKKYYTRNNWAGCIKRGESWILDSPFNNAMAHQLNLLCFFAGNSFEETAKLKTVQANLFRTNPSIQNADNAAIEIVTQDNIKLLYYATHNSSEIQELPIIIRGSKGFIKHTFTKTVFNIDGNEECIDNNDSRDHIMDALIAKIQGKENFICTLDIAGAQTIAMNATHASASVTPVPSEYVETLDNNDSTYECLKDISKIIPQAFNEERLLNTQDYPWMQTGKVIDVQNDDIIQLIKENTKGN